MGLFLVPLESVNDFTSFHGGQDFSCVEMKGMSIKRILK